MTAEVGDSSLFGARFRMNAGRALLLPRGNPRRRMPLWLQRLKAQDLLEAVREFPSFPILVETYRDVLQDAFDLAALRTVLRKLEEGALTMKVVATESPSPMAASLQFGFVMDWMYADDTPRAERAAALLSLDTALLEDLLGTPGELEEHLSDALAESVARRRGTHPDRRARTADELAILLDRAGDLALDELRERAADAPEPGPVTELLRAARAVEIEIPTATGPARRVVLIEALPKYLSAFEGIAIPDHVPAQFRRATLTRGAARREILARFLALTGPVTLADVRARYDVPADWLDARLAEWTQKGMLLRGRFSLPGYESAMRWCSRRLVEQARRRALSMARKQVEAVPMAAFSLFLQRWQHLAPGTQLAGFGGVADVVRQLYGIARPPLAWTSDYIPARVEEAHPSMLSQLSASGELVWAGEGGGGAPGAGRSARRTGRLRSVRFVRRGTERAWLAPVADPPLGERARKIFELLQTRGASFFYELQQASGQGTHALRDALRELVVAGLATNDSAEALGHVARWRPLLSERTPEEDPARWLPADFTPSPDRPVVQRRLNLRRLPKWKRPDREGGDAPWPGRWSLLDRTLSPDHHLEREESVLAGVIASQWLERYGVVARDWWRRERPPVPWRAIYRELRRMELRGEVRRGYFVNGLAGAQFALAAAVEQLRAAATGDEAFVVMSASDPANVWSLRILNPEPADTALRPRDASALLVTRGGTVLLTAERRARWVRVRSGLTPDVVTAAVAVLVNHITARRSRDLTIETIDGDRATNSGHAKSFLDAGLRLIPAGLRYYASFAR